MDTMMTMQGVLAETQKHAAAAATSLDRLDAALQQARQAGGREQASAALERAQRALDEAREHLSRSTYSLGLGGDLQRLEMNPAGAAPHLGGEHETGPGRGSPPGPAGDPHGGHGMGAPTPGSRGASAPALGSSGPSRLDGAGGGGVGLPSLIQGTPGLRGQGATRSAPTGPPAPAGGQVRGTPGAGSRGRTGGSGGSPGPSGGR